jgi:hypothetical protein
LPEFSYFLYVIPTMKRCQKPPGHEIHRYVYFLASRTGGSNPAGEATTTAASIRRAACHQHRFPPRLRVVASYLGWEGVADLLINSNNISQVANIQDGRSGSMSNRQELLESIAATITDYRADDLPAPTPAHVETWINQFDAGVQLPILSEIDHVLKNTYFSLQKVAHFLKVVLKSEKLAGADPGAFWRSVRFLDIQGGGNSQRDMLALFGELLKETHGIAIEQGGEESGAFVYLDDVVFTGNRVLHDLADWIQSDAPAAATVHVVSMALHTGGVHYARGKIAEVARTYGKSIAVQFWSAVTLEDRKTRTYMSDVLRPVSIPEAPEVMEYVAAMKYKPELRIAGDVGRNKIFSSEAGRHVLEQEFLKAGVNMAICAQPPRK